MGVNYAKGRNRETIYGDQQRMKQTYTIFAIMTVFYAIVIFTVAYSV